MHGQQQQTEHICSLIVQQTFFRPIHPSVGRDYPAGAQVAAQEDVVAMCTDQ